MINLMKAITYLMFIALFSVSLATAGDKGEQEDLMREAIARDKMRARESAKSHSDTGRFEVKFGAAKKKHPDHFAALIAANKKAAEAWASVANKAEGATHLDTLTEAKQIASSATADALLAEMTLKYAASAEERKNMMEKTRDRDVAALIAKLDANEKALLLANRAKNDAQASTEKLSIENRALNNELRKTFDEARKKDDGNNRDRDRDKEREKEKREKEKKDHDADGGGGVLGR
jgi:hypothetical protein